jgi:hypothetical protein
MRGMGIAELGSCIHHCSMDGMDVNLFLELYCLFFKFRFPNRLGWLLCWG